MVSASGPIAPGTIKCGKIFLAPSNLDQVFTVSALKVDNTTLDSSAVGPALVNSSIQTYIKPDVVAIGHQVVSSILTMDSSSEYASLSGSPVASAVVTGAVALLLSARPELVRNVEETVRAIHEAADPMLSGLCDKDVTSPNFEFGYGNMNVGAAFDQRTPVMECLEIVELECVGCLPTTDECVRAVATDCCYLPACRRDAYFEAIAAALVCETTEP